MPVSCCEAPDYARAGDGGGDNRDEVCELGFEDRVEGLGSAGCEEAVGICKGGEDADLVAILEGGADGHVCGCWEGLGLEEGDNGGRGGGGKWGLAG